MRGRGRGRARFRARPPPAIRNSMQELGMTSLFGAIPSERERENVDAARAFFPPIPDDEMPHAVRLSDKEKEIVSLFGEISESLRASPANVQPKQSAKSELMTSLLHARRYFYEHPNGNDTESKRGDLWNNTDPWLIPEMLPSELRLKSETSAAKAARLRFSGQNGEREHVPLVSNRVVPESDLVQEGLLVPIGGELGDEEHANEENHEDGEEPGEIVEEDDDLELDADYETGFHFDDDDGYEEADSGNEEATF